jgi:hypothetical protein
MPTNSAGPPINPDNVLALEPGERRRPGRPRSIGRAPSEHERARHSRVRDRLEEFVKNDVVVRATVRGVDQTSTDSLDATMLALARECAALKWDREKAQAELRSGSEKIASRHTEGLMRLAILVLDRAKLGSAENLDVRSPRFQKLVSVFLSQLTEAAQGTLSPAEADCFLSELHRRLEGWEERVR